MKQYIKNLSEALKTPGAREFYFPMNATRRKQANERLARAFGAGLATFSIETVQAELGAAYGQLVVMHSLDQTGVQIDAKSFNEIALQSRANSLKFL